MPQTAMMNAVHHQRRARLHAFPRKNAIAVEIFVVRDRMHWTSLSIADEFTSLWRFGRSGRLPRPKHIESCPRDSRIIRAT
jgi:hypothetical protein